MMQAVYLVGQSVDHVFQVGEQISYKIYYNWKFVWVPAGEVHFSVEGNTDSLTFKAVGQTYPSYDSFFKVRDYYESHVCASSLMPSRFCRQVSEGSYNRFDSLSFKQNPIIVEEYFGKSRDDAKRFEFDLQHQALDMLSAIYHVRSQDFERWQESDANRTTFNVFFDKELFNIGINHLGIKLKKLKGMGRKRVHHLQAELVDGYVFNEGDRMDIYVSDDAKKIPLLVESPISFGSIKAVLKTDNSGFSTYKTDD